MQALARLAKEHAGGAGHQENGLCLVTHCCWQACIAAVQPTWQQQPPAQLAQCDSPQRLQLLLACVGQRAQRPQGARRRQQRCRRWRGWHAASWRRWRLARALRCTRLPAKGAEGLVACPTATAHCTPGCFTDRQMVLPTQCTHGSVKNRAPQAKGCTARVNSHTARVTCMKCETGTAVMYAERTVRLPTGQHAPAGWRLLLLGRGRGHALRRLERRSRRPWPSRGRRRQRRWQRGGLVHDDAQDDSRAACDRPRRAGKRADGGLHVVRCTRQ